jgi:hypothetical protein
MKGLKFPHETDLREDLRGETIDFASQIYLNAVVSH